MKKILERISWITRKWAIRIDLLKISLHDNDGTWGIRVLDIKKGVYSRCLLCFEFRLPNKTTVRKFTIDSWDILFLYRRLYSDWDRLSENDLYGTRFSPLTRIYLDFLNFIIK